MICENEIDKNFNEFKKGWRNESARHALARKGIKTKVKKKDVKSKINKLLFVL